MKGGFTCHLEPMYVCGCMCRHVVIQCTASALILAASTLEPRHRLVHDLYPALFVAAQEAEVPVELLTAGPPPAHSPSIPFKHANLSHPSMPHSSMGNASMGNAPASGASTGATGERGLSSAMLAAWVAALPFVQHISLGPGWLAFADARVCCSLWQPLKGNILRHLNTGIIRGHY